MHKTNQYNKLVEINIDLQISFSCYCLLVLIGHDRDSQLDIITFNLYCYQCYSRWSGLYYSTAIILPSQIKPR